MPLVARVAPLVAVVLLASCTARAGGTPQGTSGPAGREDDAGPPVIEVAYAELFTTRHITLAGLVPIVSVYADGRVITELPLTGGPPGPAMSELRVATVPVDRVEELVRQAVDAGVGRDVDPVPDRDPALPATRFIVRTDDGTGTTDVQDLAGATESPGDLSAVQRAARAPFAELLASLTDAGDRGNEPYLPQAIAVEVTAAVTSDSPLSTTVDWPGPPLPTGDGARCVVVAGDDVEAVLEAAAGADSMTSWRDADGRTWTLLLQPLLPHQDGCEDR